MKLSRQKAMEFLLQDESMVMHGYSANEVRNMTMSHLANLLNLVFEPIDEDDPYTVETIIIVPKFRLIGDA